MPGIQGYRPVDLFYPRVHTVRHAWDIGLWTYSIPGSTQYDIPGIQGYRSVDLFHPRVHTVDRQREDIVTLKTSKNYDQNIFFLFLYDTLLFRCYFLFSIFVAYHEIYAFFSIFPHIHTCTHRDPLKLLKSTHNLPHTCSKCWCHSHTLFITMNFNVDCEF